MIPKSEEIEFWKRASQTDTHIFFEVAGIDDWMIINSWYSTLNHFIIEHIHTPHIFSTIKWLAALWMRKRDDETLNEVKSDTFNLELLFQKCNNRSCCMLYYIIDLNNRLLSSHDADAVPQSCVWNEVNKCSLKKYWKINNINGVRKKEHLTRRISTCLSLHQTDFLSTSSHDMHKRYDRHNLIHFIQKN